MFLEEMISVLEAADVGQFDADLFASASASIPTGPGPITTLVEYAGAGSLRTADSSDDAYEQLNAQLLVHARNFTDARDKAWQAYRALGAVENIDIQGTWYIAVVPKQTPFDMGLDGDARAQVGFNFRAMKRPSQ
jgi:hypothetical protein